MILLRFSIVFGMFFSISSQAMFPKRMQTGHLSSVPTHRERFAQVMQELQSLRPEIHEQMQARALAAQMEDLLQILPAWAQEVPMSLLLYVGFEAGDNPLTRAFRFMRLALLLRDMYEDYHINHHTFLTFPTPLEQQLPPERHHFFVAQAFYEAYLIAAQLEGELEGQQPVDFHFSVTQLAQWAFYQYLQAGPAYTQQAIQSALDTMQHAHTVEAALMLEQNEAGMLEKIRQLKRMAASFLAQLYVKTTIILVTMFALQVGWIIEHIHHGSK